MGGSSACVSRREELHVSDLGDGCPVAVPPAVTTQTTEQALHVSCFVPEFSGELKLLLLCLKVFDYKMQKSWSYLRSSWSVCAARAGAQLGLMGTLFLFII